MWDVVLRPACLHQLKVRLVCAHEMMKMSGQPIFQAQEVWGSILKRVSKAKQNQGIL